MHADFCQLNGDNLIDCAPPSLECYSQLRTIFCVQNIVSLCIKSTLHDVSVCRCRCPSKAQCRAANTPGSDSNSSMHIVVQNVDDNLKEGSSKNLRECAGSSSCSGCSSSDASMSTNTANEGCDASNSAIEIVNPSAKR
jgi:hypothetical protein